MDRINKFIGQFPDLKYDGAKIVCLLCNTPFVCRSKRDCFRHVNSQKHKYKKCGHRSKDEFALGLIFMLTACNIPFKIVKKEPFRKLWAKYSPGHVLPSESTLRNYLPFARQKTENSIKAALKEKKLWLSCDETTDCKRNYILSITVRTLEPLQYSSPLLLANKRLSHRTGDAIHNVIRSTLEKFELTPNQVMMFVTDATTSMLRAGSYLKNDCSTLLHVTCLLHALHLVAETIRRNYSDVDSLITNTTKIFLKSPKRVREFRKHCPSIREPPQPIPTRCGTWLQAAFYYYKHFHEIKPLILQFNAEELIAIKESQLQFQSAQVEADLQTIHTNYVVIATAIEQLQNSSLALRDQFKIVDEVEAMLYTLDGPKSVRVLDKYRSVLSKNADFARLKQIYGYSSSTDPLVQLKDHFNYANITTVDTERSSSLYNSIFTQRRTSFSEKNVEAYAMMQMFSLANLDC
ncbi:hypothetical protein Trydic_g21359 [Trypoxylus dichotomus]